MAFESDEVFQAHRELLLLGTFFTFTDADHFAIHGHLKDLAGCDVPISDPRYQAWADSGMYKEIIADIKILIKLLRTNRELEEYKAHGWHSVSKEQNKKTWYRAVPGMPSLDVACECVINAHIFKPLSMFAEVDLYSSWVPRLHYCHVEKDFSRFRKTVEWEVSFPWPFHNRSGVCHGYGTTLPEQNAVIVVVRTINDDPATKEHLGCVFPPPKNSWDVHLKVNCGCMYFRYIDENTTLFRGLFNIDPNMSLVPQWLINYVMKKVAYTVLGLIQEKSKNFEGSVFEKRVNENTYMYDEIRRRLNLAIKK